MNNILLKDFINKADKARLRMRGICVYHEGQKLDEYYWLIDERRNVHSVSKSFTSVAIGKLVSDGFFSLTDKIAPIFEDKLPSNPDPRMFDISIEDLLTMRVGMAEAMNNEFRTCVFEDTEKYYLSRPMSNSPGTVFDYDTGATYMLAAIVQRTIHVSVRDYLQANLFNPLGIENVTWPSCKKGITIGGSGLMLSVEEMARFGELLLQHGNWKGNQIIPSAYLDLAATSHTHTPEQFTGTYGLNEGRFKDCIIEYPDVPPTRAPRGYGYQFWTEIYKEKYPSAFYCMGSWGKWIIVVPEKKAAIAVCAHEPTDHGQMIIEKLVETELLDKL